MKPKVAMSKEDQINFWIQEYLQAKATGDHTKIKIFESIIKKLGGKVPKI